VKDEGHHRHHLDIIVSRHHDVNVRTTLTLDPDVAKLLEEETRRQRRPFKHVVNDAIRRGLAPATRRKKAPAFRVEPHRASLAPGLDRGALNRLADELETDAVVGKTRES
jgi:hypothetical protein